MNEAGFEAKRPSAISSLCPALRSGRALFAGGLDEALVDLDLGLLVLPDVDAVDAAVEDVEGGVGGVELDALFLLQGADDEVDVTRPDADAGDVVVLLGQVEDVDLGVVVEPDVVALAEVDLGPAVGGADPVAFADGHVERAFLVAEVGSPLDEGLALDETQAGDGFVGIFRVLDLLSGLRARGLSLLGVGASRNQEERSRDDECLLHCPSPSPLFLIARTMPMPLPDIRGEKGLFCPK